MHIHVRIAIAAITLLASAPALAHFYLVEPPSYAGQGPLGDPQKNPPCGQFDTIVGPTGAVTTYEEGATIDITISERIFHPGHYRVAIAESPEALPETPPVTAGSTACGSTVIDEAPTLPILADGMLVHETPLSGDQTFQVQLPAGFTCEECTLQVVEFMSNHGLNDPGGCFYHHCATVSVVAAASDDVGTTDAGDADAGDGGADAGEGDTGAPTGGDDTDGVDAGADASGDPQTGDTSPADASGDGRATPTGGGGSGGCSLAAVPRGGSGALAAFLVGALLVRRRRGL